MVEYSVGAGTQLCSTFEALGDVVRRAEDRKIGEGHIPVESWPQLFAGLPGVSVAVETPYGSPEADAQEVRLVKELAGGLRKAPNRI